MTMSDDVLYTILLLVSVAAGPLVRFSPNPRLKRIVSSLLGVAIVIFACHWDALHPLIVTLINCLLILVLGPRYSLPTYFRFVFMTRQEYAIDIMSASCKICFI